MNITLFAPYAYCETTWAALVLAERLSQLGHRVRWAAACSRLCGIHPTWDARVRTARLGGLRSALWRADCLISFVPSVWALEEADLVSPRARTVLVLSSCCPETLRSVIVKYGHIVCLSKAAHEHLRAFLPGSQRRLVSWTFWDALGALLRRPAGTFKRRLLLLGGAADAAVLRQMVTRVRGRWSECKITVATLGRWPRRCRKPPCPVARVTPATWSALCGGADLVGSTRTGGDYALLELEALAAGAPLVVYDVEPCGQLVSAVCCGRAVACGIATSNWLGAQTATVSGVAFADACAAMLDDAAVPTAQAADWRLAERRRAFYAFWQHLLG